MNMSQTEKETLTDLEKRAIRDFHIVKKGATVAYKASGENIYAQSDFVHILFGENRYTDIFGFMWEER